MEAHPFYVVIAMFVLVVLLTVYSYTTGTFLSFFSNAGNRFFQNNTLGNSIYVNDVIANNVYVGGFNIINQAIVLITILALVMDVFISYYDPHRGQGVMNIFLIFAVAFIYTGLKFGVSALSMLNLGSTVTPLAYNFFTSLYFIMIVVFFMVVSTILNFRHSESSSDYSGSIRDTNNTR